MADIKITYAYDNALAIIAIKGTIVCVEAIETVEKLYANSPPSLVLIELTEANVSQLTEVQLIEITHTLAKYAPQRKGGKTALVVPTDLKYGLGRMLEALYVSEVADVDLRSFRTADEAKQWLGIDSL